MTEIWMKTQLVSEFIMLEFFLQEMMNNVMFTFTVGGNTGG